MTLTFCYWILVATPVFRADFASALPIGSWTTVGLFYIFVAAVFGAIPFLRKWKPFQKFVAWKLWWPTPREDALKVGITLGICAGFSILFTFVNIFGSNFILLPAATAYAVQMTTSQFEESISVQVIDAADWMKDHVRTNLTVASDHRISQILWTRGFNVTSDEAYWIFFAANWTGALDELNGTNRTYGKVGYVFIDDIMRTKGVQSNLNESPRAHDRRVVHQILRRAVRAGAQDLQRRRQQVGGGLCRELDVYRQGGWLEGTGYRVPFDQLPSIFFPAAGIWLSSPVCNRGLSPRPSCGPWCA